MNQSYIHYILLLLIGWAFAACSSMPDELKTAEQLIETAPDSALRILKQINSNKLCGARNKAFYALLMSQALDKNDIKAENDSLISIATDYFDASDPVHAGYAWFYHARTASNRGSVDEQAANLLKAQEYAEMSSDHKLLGLVYGDKGLMYKNQLLYDSTILYSKLAYEEFYKMHDYKNCVLGLLNMGDNFMNISKHDSTLKYLYIAEKTVLLTKDTLLLSSVYRSLGSIYLKLKNFNQALNYFHKAPLTKITIYDSNKYYLLAKTYIQIGKLDSARIYLNKVTELQTMAPDYYRLWETLAEKDGNSIQAIYYANKLTTATDSIYKRKLDVSFAGLEKKYKYQGLQLSNQSLTIKNKQKGFYLLLLLLAISVFGVIVLVWRLRAKKKEADYLGDIALKRQELLVKKQELLEKEQETSAKQRENNILLERELKLQSILLSNINMHQTNSVKRPALWREGSKETIEKQHETFYKELKMYLDMEYTNFTTRLKEKHPTLTEGELFISCLLLAKFETGMIATILDVQADSINKQRYRLRTKFQLAKSDNLIDYLLHF